MQCFVFAMSISSSARTYDSWPDKFLAIQMVNVVPAPYAGVQSVTSMSEKLRGSIIKDEATAIRAPETPKHPKL